MTTDTLITAVSRIAGKDGKPASKLAASTALMDALIELEGDSDLGNLLSAHRKMDNASYRADADALEQWAEDFHGIADTIFEAAGNDAQAYRDGVAA